MNSPLVCPHCKAALDRAFCCPGCARCYPDGDFAEGRYYDHFDGTTPLTPEHAKGLELELEGTRRRILDFYLPLLPRGARVLDCGCGNGLSVDLLTERGFDAWGNDLSQLRKWQWREREHRDRLVVASALTLPFADDAFDVVISSGVIEHIGVSETSVPRYAVTPLPNRDELRAAFLRELLRVAPTVYLDCPNGAFPIDFWHGDTPGSARFHSLREGFLPTFSEIRAIAPRVEPLSPYKRLQFRQASQHWYGRLLGRPADWFFRFMPKFVAKSAINPFLVLRVERAGFR
ncbi:MAG TPA: class I SAM-dependent methyltransferase [Thermoanaerobaculia bacterium]|nr:class I SAM-dependent methyltransferase [Thermoanaerobaculia bacterium]